MAEQTFKARLKEFSDVKSIAEYLTAVEYDVILEQTQNGFSIDAKKGIETDVHICDKCKCVAIMDFYYCPSCGEKAN